MKSLEFPTFTEDQAYMVTGKTLNAFVRAIRENQVLNSPDISVTQRSDGVILTVNHAPGQAAESEFPFKVRPTTGGFIIQPGTVANKMPTILGVDLPFNPILAVPSSGVSYIFIKVTFSFATNLANTLVLGGSVTSAEVVCLSSIPAPSFSAGVGIDYLYLATCEDGVLTHESYIRRSLSITICDNGLGDGLPTLIASAAG